MFCYALRGGRVPVPSALFFKSGRLGSARRAAFCLQPCERRGFFARLFV